MPPRILVVDDEADARDSLQALLDTLGYRVETACDGADALRQCRARLPDIVLTDLLMPVMDGVAVAKALRADALTASVRIVLCSGIAEPRVRLLFSAYDAYLEKPYEAAVLERIVRALAPLRAPA